MQGKRFELSGYIALQATKQKLGKIAAPGARSEVAEWGESFHPGDLNFRPPTAVLRMAL